MNIELSEEKISPPQLSKMNDSISISPIPKLHFHYFTHATFKIYNIYKHWFANYLALSS